MPKAIYPRRIKTCPKSCFTYDLYPARIPLCQKNHVGSAVMDNDQIIFVLMAEVN
jgi:hypothetical protein